MILRMRFWSAKFSTKFSTRFVTEFWRKVRFERGGARKTAILVQLSKLQKMRARRFHNNIANIAAFA
jgi:hypothetical protein